MTTTLKYATEFNVRGPLSIGETLLLRSGVPDEHTEMTLAYRDGDVSLWVCGEPFFFDVYAYNTKGNNAFWLVRELKEGLRSGEPDEQTGLFTTQELCDRLMVDALKLLKLN